ncbi:hypothetical protein SAMN05216288_0727 [Pseudomonas punonensis]|uniref:Uncharacterized protein n=1 Tax=Phytopseudomonas punonensis TaxID=1220495 RepID=A0A1M6WTE8_9GAMM|nr:hypothetical protein SAMN05216288_0727 [Pseudomonas punonensis]
MLRGVVRTHGTLVLENRPAGGLAVELWLPACDE